MSVCHTLREALAHEGKNLRTWFQQSDRCLSYQVGFLNVFAADLGIVIEQLPCLKGAGEKIAAQQFVDSRTEAELKGKVILADAIHTDSQLISRLEKKGSLSPHCQR